MQIKEEDAAPRLQLKVTVVGGGAECVETRGEGRSGIKRPL